MFPFFSKSKVYASLIYYCLVQQSSESLELWLILFTKHTGFTASPPQSSTGLDHLNNQCYGDMDLLLVRQSLIHFKPSIKNKLLKQHYNQHQHNMQGHHHQVKRDRCRFHHQRRMMRRRRRRARLPWLRGATRSWEVSRTWPAFCPSVLLLCLRSSLIR